MIRVLIADDHEIVRKGLKEIVNETEDITVEDEARDGYDALAKISKGQYDIVVLDIAMPGPSGIEILRQIKSENPGLSVLMLSMYPEEQYAVSALRAGASGYLTKDSAPAELIAAIRKAYAGGKYVNSILAERLAFHVEDPERPLHEKLSDREFKVMVMIAEGKRLKEIGSALFISEKTVSSYRYRVLDKLGLKSNADLTRYAIKNRLID